MYTVGHEIWQETMKNLKNKTCTLQNLEYGKKHSKSWKMKHSYCRTWNMARKQKIMENEKHTQQ